MPVRERCDVHHGTVRFDRVHDGVADFSGQPGGQPLGRIEVRVGPHARLADRSWLHDRDADTMRCQLTAER